MTKSTAKSTTSNAGTKAALEEFFVHQVAGGDAGILDAQKIAAEAMVSGRGVAFDFSTIRTGGSSITTPDGRAANALESIKAFDAISESVQRGSPRRTARLY